MTKPRKRSVSYPGVNLEEAVSLSQQLDKHAGQGPYSRDLIATALGHKGITGRSTMKIAALSQYGLIDKIGTGAYQHSELLQRILRPTSEQDKKTALMQAAQSPKLYSEILDQFDGKALPTLIDNILVRQFNVTPKAAGDAADVFSQTLDYAGLLVNGVVNTKPNRQNNSSANQDKEEGESAVENKEQVSENDKNEHSSKREMSRAPQTDHLAHSLPSGIQIAFPPSGIQITFPEHLTFPFVQGNFSEAVALIEEIAKKFKTDTTEAKTGKIEKDDSYEEQR